VAFFDAYGTDTGAVAVPVAGVTVLAVVVALPVAGLAFVVVVVIAVVVVAFLLAAVVVAFLLVAVVAASSRPRPPKMITLKTRNQTRRTMTILLSWWRAPGPPR
jgi:hypothetical protein